MKSTKTQSVRLVDLENGKKPCFLVGDRIKLSSNGKLMNMAELALVLQRRKGDLRKVRKALDNLGRHDLVLQSIPTRKPYTVIA